MSWYTYKKGKTMGEISEMASQSSAKISKKGREPHPITITGRTIARSWWGKAWCANLEGCADFSNRLSRGKSYVRAGAIIDIQIDRGSISALVQGSRKKPYEVDIDVLPIPPSRAKKILESCSSRASTLEALASGDIPEDMKEMFTSKDGIFPSPREIKLYCSCPDWAAMCKHVAAVLYGVGALFDEEPLSFFELRGIDTADLIMKGAVSKVERMLANADAPSPRIIPEAALEMFGL